MSPSLFLLALLQPQEAAEPLPEPPVDRTDAVHVVERTDDLTFEYSWPLSLREYPKLERLMVRWRDEARRREASEARSGRREAAREAAGPPRWEYQEHWGVLGGGAPLLSLVANITTYSGGAHGNLAYRGLIWDTGRQREVRLTDLFARGEWPRRFRARYCAALNREREERWNEPVPQDGFANRCPELGDYVVLPADLDENGRFEALQVLLPPYAAGSYSEGPYEISVTFEPADLPLVAERVRPAFEAKGR